MKRAFISYDYDHDADLKTVLTGQAQYPDAPFRVTDFSVKEEFVDNWKNRAKNRMKKCDLVIVICGEHTNTARGVSAELQIAQEESLPYFLLTGRQRKPCVKPAIAQEHDKVYDWTWDSLKVLVEGLR